MLAICDVLLFLLLLFLGARFVFRTRSGQLDLLPDSARRSRHQDHLFPFSVSPPDDGEGNSGTDLVLAVDNGLLMWEWVGRLGVLSA